MLKQIVKRRLKKVGGSVCIVIPQEVLLDTGWKVGTILQCIVMESQVKGKSIVFFSEPTPEGFLVSTFFKVLGKIRLKPPASKEKADPKEKP